MVLVSGGVGHLCSLLMTPLHLPESLCQFLEVRLALSPTQ